MGAEQIIRLWQQHRDEVEDDAAAADTEPDEQQMTCGDVTFWVPNTKGPTNGTLRRR